jgi:hypothetical protein
LLVFASKFSCGTKWVNFFGQEALMIPTFLNLSKMHQDFSPNHWIGPQKLFVTPKMGEILDKKM